MRVSHIGGVAVGAMVLAMAGCAGGGGALRAAGDPTPGAVGAFNQIKSLEGTWAMLDEKKQPTDMTIQFHVSSAGSVVREIMFPGQTHEMTNVYSIDGPTLIVTHYCAEGNQPTMRLRRPTGAGPLAFTLDHVTNYAGGKQTYMGELTLVPLDSDHLREDWKSFQGGSKDGEPVSFLFQRVK